MTSVNMNGDKVSQSKSNHITCYGAPHL